LSWNRIQNTGAVALAEAAEVCKLSRLDLDNNLVAEMGMIRLAIAAASSSSNFEKLVLERVGKYNALTLYDNWRGSDVTEMAVCFWTRNFEYAMDPVFTLLQARVRVGRASVIKRLPNDMLRLVGEMFAISLFQKAEEGYYRYVSSRDLLVMDDWDDDEVAEARDRPIQNPDPPQPSLIGIESKALHDSILRTVGHFNHTYELDPDDFLSSFL
jgi:hypothetical protein